MTPTVFQAWVIESALSLPIEKGVTAALAFGIQKGVINRFSVIGEGPLMPNRARSDGRRAMRLHKQESDCDFEAD